MWVLGKEPRKSSGRSGLLTTEPSQQPAWSFPSYSLLSSILLQDHLTVALSLVSCPQNGSARRAVAAQPGRKRKSNCLGTDEVGLEEQREREAGKGGVGLGMVFTR